MRGPWLPRNLAINHASCDYICFHDVDDVWLPRRLSNLVDYMNNNASPYLLFCNVLKANEDLSFCYPKPRFVAIPPRYQIFVWNPFILSSVAINRSVIAGLRFKPVRHEDFIFFFDLLINTPSISCHLVPTYDCIYRVSVTSLSGNKFHVLPWWFSCYSYFRLPIPLRLLFISLKLLAELIEKLSVLTHLIPSAQLHLPRRPK